MVLVFLKLNLILIVFLFIELLAVFDVLDFIFL